jgi:hypothetical protein
VVDDPAGVFVVVVDVELSLLGAGFTMVVSFFSPGVTTVVLLSAGGVLTLASHAANRAATAAHSMVFFIRFGFRLDACLRGSAAQPLIR